MDARPRPRRPSLSLLFLGAFAALLAAGFAHAAMAAPQQPLQQVTPFSWVQFKQQYGVLDTTNGNDISLPGTTTVLADSAQVAASGGFTGANLTVAQQIEGWLLGDIGPSETPIPKNYLRDANAFLTGGYQGVDTWTAPFYSLTNSLQALSTVTIDNDNEFNPATDNYSFNDIYNNTNGTFQIVYGMYVDGTYSGPWTGAPANPLQNPSNGAPVEPLLPATGAAPSETNGWQSSQGDPIYEQNYFIEGYRRTINTSTTASTGLVQRHNANGTLNAPTALATWAFGLPNTAGTIPPIVQPPTTPVSNTDATNSTIPPVTTPVLVKPTVTAQSYDAYAWFPSENASPFATNPELHITDAEYTVQVVNPYNNQVIYSFTAYADQTAGGVWVRIAGPFNVPIVVNPATIGTANVQSGPALVLVTLDNTTDMTVNDLSVTQLPNYYVVADAIQLRPDNGYMYGAPVVANVSDYPELAGGYPDGFYNPTTGQDMGGLPITYRAARESGGTATSNGANTSGGQYFAPNANGQYVPPNGEYTEDQWGDKWANAGPDPADFYWNPPTLPATTQDEPPADVTLSTPIEQGNPIDQVVYMTRSENIGGFANGTEQTIGTVYAVDGLTGNVIWRYPSVLPFVTDDYPGAPAFLTSGTSTNTQNTPNFTTWTQVSAPDTNFYNVSYNVVNAENAADASAQGDAVATWVPQNLTVAPQNYYVYVWFPSATAGEQHIPDAQYAVNGIACTAVNQTVGGQWVELTQASNNSPFFSLAAGATITLNNLTSAAPMSGTPSEPVGYYVVADAVLLVPADAPGPITSTPILVRNMRVLTNPTTNTYSPRTCLIFTDNSTGAVSTNSITVDDFPLNGPQFTSNGAASANQGDTWTQVTGPGTNFFDSTYTRITAEAATNPAPPLPVPLVTWSPQDLPTQAMNYNVFVWYPKPGAGETYITDAQYGVVDQKTQPTAGYKVNPINQTTNGGQWVELTWDASTADPADTVFTLANDAQITLSNLTNTNTPPNQPSATTYVVADAVMLVPTNGGVNSTTGGRIYCLDAAGDGNGDDTIVDQNNEPVSYQSGSSTVGNLAPPSNNPTYTYVGPLQPIKYGTTHTYWIWQPNPLSVIAQNRGNETPETAPNDPAPDPNRDLPVPGAYEMNSPTVNLVPVPAGVAGLNSTFSFGTSTAYLNSGASYPSPAPADQAYFATIYVGNSNGILYALDGQGVVDNPADQNLFDNSIDPTTPTLDVYWWFGTSGSIAYAPSYDPLNNAVYVTDYAPDGTNQGRVFALKTGTYTAGNNQFNGAIQSLNFNDDGGPIGNFGKGDPQSTDAFLPGALNYNLDQIPFWSFPDGYGTVVDATNHVLPNTEHLVTSTVPSNNGNIAPALPLGDIAGAPSVYTDSNGTTRIYVAANDPTPDDLGPGANGRIYALYTGNNGHNAGSLAWVYPDIAQVPSASNVNGPPNAVGNTTQQADVFDYVPNSANPTALPHQPLGPFTDYDSSAGLFVSSSPVEGQVTFPIDLFPSGDNNTTNPNLFGPNGNSLGDQDVQMLYTGCSDGVLYALNIGPSLGTSGTASDDDGTNANVDALRLIYNEPIGDGPIFSTPALLSGSATNSSNSTQSDVGGVVFLTTSVGNIWEFEATPFADPNAAADGDTTVPIVNRDWGWAGPGGLSSPALGAFDATNFAVSPPQPSPVVPSPTRNDSEWVYAGSDNGFLYAFTPNISTGGGFFPSQYIPTQNVGPNSNVNLTREMLSEVFWQNPISGGSVNWSQGGAPPTDPAFDWGQEVWIVIAGIDNPSPAVNDGVTHPRGLNLSFDLVQSNGSGGTTTTPTFNKPLVPGDPNIVQITNFPPAGQPSNSVQTYGQNGDGNYYGYVYGPITIGPVQPALTAGGAPASNTAPSPYTPGPAIQVSDIVEQADLNGSPQTIQGSSRTPLIVNTGASGSGTSTYGYVQGGDEVSFGVLNPIGVAGGGVTLNGSFQTLATSPGSFTAAPEVLGPFNGVDGTSNANFAAPNGFQMADGNGNIMPITPPVGGSVTTSGGGTVNPTAPLSAQGMGFVGAAVDVISDPGEVSHGGSGDTGISNPAQPNPQAGSGGSNALNAPGLNNDAPYGPSMLVVGDRSAWGTLGNDITNLRMSSPEFVWNDNTTSNSNVTNASPVINMLPWDQAPANTNNDEVNYSLDYPNIPRGNVHAQMVPRTDTATGGANGGQGDPTQSSQTLASSPAINVASTGNSLDTAQVNRTVRPNGVIVQVQIPKYQPANLESYDDTSFLQGGEHSHVQNTNGNNAGKWVPEGYKSHARVFIDMHGTGEWAPDDPYREVNVWVGVPVDMSTAINQPTTDIGAVPGGFGLWNPDLGAGTLSNTWSPYALPQGGGSEPQYEPWFIQVPVYNTGNVNLLNVHFDQQVATYVDSNGSMASGLAPYGEYLGLQSDAVTDQIADAGQNQLWPFYDSGGGYTGQQQTFIVRSNLDTNVYSAAIMNPVFNTIAAPGPTAHKARPVPVGTSSLGAALQIPDNPLDLTNADHYTPPTNSPPDYYANNPALSVAVPLGTPVGTYYQTARTFEGSDAPFNAWMGPTYGGGFYIPGIWNAGGNVENSFVFDQTSGTPLQFYSDPGTQIVAHVVEDRLTDDDPLYANEGTNSSQTLVTGALPMIDPARLQSNGSTSGNATPTGSNDIQPWAFADTTNLAANAEPSLGVLWPSQRALTGQSPARYDIFADSLNGGSTTAGGSLILPTSSASWWSGTQGAPAGAPDNITQNPATPPSGTAPLTSYSPYVVQADNFPQSGGPDQGTNENTALRVDSVVGGAPSYALMYSNQFTGTEPPLDPATSNTRVWNTLTTSTTPIFGPRGCYMNDTALISQPLIVFWAETSGGRSQIFYQSPNGYPLVPATAPATAPAVAPATLQIPAGVSNVSDPTAVTRPFLYPWPNAAGTGVSYWPVVDVTYSGVSALTGEVDVYTSRYIVWTNASGVAVLQLVPFGVQPSTTANTITETAVSETLAPNSTNSVWEAPDVGWVRDLSTFSLTYTPAGGPNQGVAQPIIAPAGTPNAPTLATPPIYDRSSGEWIFNNVNLPNWTNNEGTNITGTVYVNPDQGTVRFSTPPSAYTPTSGNTAPIEPAFTATFVPQALRATIHSGTNTTPVAFIDEAAKPNTLQLPAQSNGAPNANQPGPALASRYWYVWRKAGAGAGGSAASTGTLYFKTRRLTVALAYPIQYAGNPSNTNAVTPPKVTITIPGVVTNQDISNLVDIDPGHYIYPATPSTAAPQMVPARIYFPDYITSGQNYSTEGAQVSITYTPAPYTANGSPVAPSQTTATGTIQWMDEPYTNSPTDTAFRSGERQVPISAVVNEGEPCAFLDPVAYWNTTASTTSAPFEHRVWLFWTSTRNAAGVNGSSGTGADLYWEALDPRFSATSPP